MTTPAEQILIDGLVFYADERNYCGYTARNRLATIEHDLGAKARKALQAYNEAKAREAKTKLQSESFKAPEEMKTNDASAQDLLTAAPLAEALKEMLKVSKRKDEFPIHTRYFTASEMGVFQHVEEHYNRSINRAIKALTQSETLIKHSEAVWAVVEKANNPWGFTHDELARFINTYEAHLEKHGYYESVVHALKSLFKPHLPVKALEMMEGKQ